MKKTFFLFAGLGLMLSACVKKQTKLEETPGSRINYTFPVKDAVFTNNSAPLLDLDKDGESDFSFSVETLLEDGWEYTHYYVEPKNKNEIILLEDIDAQAHPLNTPINATTKPNDNWSNHKGLLLEVQERTGGKPVSTGNWSRNTSQAQYLPVRLNKNNKFYYGWIAMNYSPSTTGKGQFIISAAAVHKLPGAEIKAGK